jgi:hypothetical protein
VLDLLLLLHGEPDRVWTRDAVAEKLACPLGWSERELERLRHGGLAWSDASGYRYAPSNARQRAAGWRLALRPGPVRAPDPNVAQPGSVSAYASMISPAPRSSASVREMLSERLRLMVHRSNSAAALGHRARAPNTACPSGASFATTSATG